MQKKKATKKKQQSKPGPKPGAKKKSGLSANGIDTDTFEIELQPPPPLTRGTTQQILDVRAKIDRTIAVLPNGAAAIIPCINEAGTKKYIREKYPKDIWLFAKVRDRKDILRMYRMTPKKPTS